MQAPTGVDPGMWLALLRWSASQGKAEGDRAEGEHSSPKQLSEEDKAFLAAALADADPIRQVKDAVEGLTSGDETRQEEALEELMDLLEDLDMANDCIGVMCQNNPTAINMYHYCDLTLFRIIITNAMCVDLKVMHLLRPMLSDASRPPLERLKALSAISALTRGAASARVAFFGEDGASTTEDVESGMDTLFRIIFGVAGEPAQDLRLQRKALFLIRSLLVSEREGSGFPTQQPIKRALIASSLRYNASQTATQGESTGSLSCSQRFRGLSSSMKELDEDVHSFAKDIADWSAPKNM